MKQNDNIVSKTNTEQTGTIVHTPRPPKLWCVLFDNGKTKHKSKSFWKKYYKVVDATEC